MSQEQKRQPVLDELIDKLPAGFIHLLGPNCLSGDYLNKLPMTFLFSMYFGAEPLDKSRKQLLIDIQRELGQTMTYTQYWRSFINEHNVHAAMKGRLLLKPEEVMSLLVTGVPAAAEVDAMALELQGLGKKAILSAELVERAARLTAKTCGLIRGGDAEEEIIIFMGLPKLS